MAEQKPDEERVKKITKKWPFKFLSSERAVAVLEFVLRTKNRSDKRMTRAFHLAGLPSLDDQADVEGVIRRQTRRLREVVAGLDELESTISRLEKSLAQDAEPRSVETPIARLAKTKAPAARKSPRKAAAAKAKKRSARKVEPVPVKPQPLGAARKAAPPTSAKSLLDLQFKKRK